MIAANTRDPASIIGDIHSQAQATQAPSANCCGWSEVRARPGHARYGGGSGLRRRAVRKRLAELPDGTGRTVDYIDRDLGAGEGMIPIRIKMTIKGDTIHYDFTGSHSTIASMYNSAPGATFSAVVAGMKTFFPDLPLNSGFYRMIEVTAPKNSVVSAEWPVAVTGFLMPFERS